MQKTFIAIHIFSPPIRLFIVLRKYLQAATLLFIASTLLFVATSLLFITPRKCFRSGTLLLRAATLLFVAARNKQQVGENNKLKQEIMFFAGRNN